MQPFFQAYLKRLLRMWQPHRLVFWLMLVFNVFSSVVAWLLHWLQPTGVALLVLVTFALANAAMGWWMLAILWRQSPDPPDSTAGASHVQSPADHQNR